MSCLKKDPKERIDIREMVGQKWMDSCPKEEMKVNNVTFTFNGAEAASSKFLGPSNIANKCLAYHFHRLNE